MIRKGNYVTSAAGTYFELQKFGKRTMVIMRINPDTMVPLQCQPFVVCESYDSESGTWGNGIYYQSIEDAVNCAALIAQEEVVPKAVLKYGRLVQIIRDAFRGLVIDDKDSARDYLEYSVLTEEEICTLASMQGSKVSTFDDAFEIFA